jgi:tetratricopeptide (TPR) repeat protein
MSNTCARSLYLTTIVFSMLSSSVAAELPVVRGRLHPPARELVQGLLEMMEDVSAHTATSRVDIRLDGSFEFRDVRTGDYTLRVTDAFGVTLYQQFVTIQEHMPELEVRLPERESDGAGARAATVSVTQLMHPPQKKAVQAYQRALRLSSAGKYGDSVTELQNAIRISPEFAAAHTNLAAQHFRLGRFEESAAESARAIQLGGPDPINLCNLATAQARLHRFAEAEKTARAALRLDPDYLKANLILGSVLADQPATRGEGIKHLEKGAAEFTSARQFLEQLRGSR